MPNERDVDPIVGVPETVSHAPDVVPRLMRHQFRGAVAQSICRLADTLDATFYRIAQQEITLEIVVICAGQVLRDALRVLDYVG